MNSTDYLEASARTENDAGVEIDRNLLHGIIGLSGEVGELMDNIKRTMFYGLRPDQNNIREECGDILWYLAQICRSQGFTFEELMDENIAKLKARYPNKFTKDDSILRRDKN